MKKSTKVTLSVLTAILSLTTNNASASFYNYYNPRLSIWGLAGEPDQVRGDFLIPIFGNQTNLFYADAQGSYTRQGNFWGNNNRSKYADYWSAGGGFRRLYNNSVLGAYLFYDRDESRRRNFFNVLSPGVEAIFCNWDGRANGYFPLNPRKTIKSSPAQLCDGTDEANCQASFFQGHQQFGHLYTFLEQAGRGGDAEVGYTFHRLNNTQLHGGVYYFNFNLPNHSWILHDNSANNLIGVEGRLEAPINRLWAVTVEASYDRLQRGAIVGGLRFNPLPVKYPCDMRSHMVDAIPRNLGTLKTGSGVPTVKAKRDDGIYLQRDNIFFFSPTGGSAFVDPNSGTFENPINGNPFSQSLIDQLPSNANLYLPTGTYLITGAGVAPNANITLPSGMSIFGRTSNYLAAATGDARPILLGGLIVPGVHTLSSFQLIDSASTSTLSNARSTDPTIIALTIPSGSTVNINNLNIAAASTINGNLAAGMVNIATGIFSQNSTVNITNSTVTANAAVTGTIDNFSGALPGGINYAAAIGGSTGAAATTINFIGNTFTIQNSTISATASAGANFWDNGAVGIGVNAANGGTANFNNNNSFSISNSTVSANVSLNGNAFSGFSFATGIGCNNDGLAIANFTNNIFRIRHTQVNASAAVTQSLTVGDNVAVGIGDFLANFINNTFTLSTNSSVTANATVTGSTAQVAGNLATGIGGVGSNMFQSNNFTLLNNCPVTVTAKISGDNTDNANNEAIGIGDSFNNSFANNIFTLSNGTSISATATVNGNNLKPTDPSKPNLTKNLATGIGVGPEMKSFTGNTFNLNSSSIRATATVGANNSALNSAIGVGNNSGIPNSSFFAGNTVNGTPSITTVATVGGINTGTNQHQNQKLTP